MDSSKNTVPSTNENDVLPDAPTMRSVSIMSSGPGLSAVGGAPSKGPLSFASKGIALGIGKPPPGICRPPRLSGRRTSFVKQEWSGSAADEGWNVKGENLEMIPWEFPLERTHREIVGTAETVSARISKALSQMSVEAEYCSEKGKAKCQTVDRVHFRIRLFAGGDNGQPIVVEIQRRSGSTSSFMHTCRALLDAAEGKDQSTSPQQTSRGSPKSALSIGSMKCLSGANVKQPDGEGELKRTLDMIKSDNGSTVVLGLESLCFLSDPTKTSPMVAQKVSKFIMTNESNDDVREELRQCVERDGFTPEFEDDQASVAHGDLLRSLSLQAMENTLLVCSATNCLSGLSTQWFKEQLIPTLLEELKRAEWNANDAFHAASCLCSAVVIFPELRRQLVEHGDDKVIEDALSVGKISHALLATEAERCLSMVRG